MRTTATVTSKGRITIPAEVRQVLKVDAGDRVEFVEVEPGRFEVVAATPSCTAKNVSIEEMNCTMRSAYNAKAPKRPVNLSLNEELIAQTRDVTNKLSEVVESLLADFVSKEKARRDAHATAVKGAVHTWSAFDEKHGAFANEHSSL